MSILKLKPAFKEYIWGGRRIITDFNKQHNCNSIAESWELSTHKDGHCLIENGVYKGVTLAEFIKSNVSVLGSNCKKNDGLPILIKLIDAKESLSIQVHPDDKFALKHENSLGKTEFWYIIDSEKDSFIYLGFKYSITNAEFKQHIKNNTLLTVLNKIKVKKGDSFYIEAGTIHSIGEGILLAEVQQNSDITYRVYDYCRKDKKGNQRELHIDKALAVTKTSKYFTPIKIKKHLTNCKYFNINKIHFFNSSYTLTVDTTSFISILVLEGSGEILINDEHLPYNKGDSFFIPAQNSKCTIIGKIEALITKFLG